MEQDPPVELVSIKSLPWPFFGQPNNEHLGPIVFPISMDVVKNVLVKQPNEYFKKCSKLYAKNAVKRSGPMDTAIASRHIKRRKATKTGGSRKEKFKVFCKLSALSDEQNRTCNYSLVLRPLQDGTDQWDLDRRLSIVYHTCHTFSCTMESFGSSSKMPKGSSTSPSIPLATPSKPQAVALGPRTSASQGPATNCLSPAPAARRQLSDEQIPSTTGEEMIGKPNNPGLCFNKFSVMQAFHRIKETLAKDLFTKRLGTHGMVTFVDIKKLYLEELSKKEDSPAVKVNYSFLIPKILKMMDGEVEAQKLPQKFGSGVLFAANLNREEYSNALA
mmetsp:Transcript_29946/g.51738  ORF Transcript_29946/g.51738 Transcript_29946/m.51738 type:complete len:331 (+) Transcript_29946:148-1140(+)